MSAPRRHCAALACAVALLTFVILAPDRWHLFAWCAAYAFVWFVDRPLRRGVGAARRWLVALAALGALGAWLGPKDSSVLGHAASLGGALAATTMVARAFALVTLSTSAMALYPPSRAVRRLSGTRLERVVEVLLIALDLVPSLIGELRQARARILAEEPGWPRTHRRLFATIVFAIEHAAGLAERIARDLAAPAPHKEPAP